MDYFDTYKKRVSGNGNVVGNTKTVLDGAFASSPFLEEVVINGAVYKAVITQGKDSDEKNILLPHSNLIDIGSLVIINDKQYLVTDFQGEGIYSIYPNASVELCNETVKIEFKTKEKLIGHDSKGRPIYDYIDLPPLQLPAIVEKTNVVESMNDAINIDEDRVKVTVSYRDIDSVDYFRVGDERFNIVSTDKTKSIDGVGLLILIGERSTD